jgi:hypothetical protein
VHILTALTAVVTLAGAAGAQTRLSVSPGLSISAGYDDNLFLDPTLTGAAPPHADAIIDFRPSLAAALVHRGHTLALDADYLERVTPSNGDLRDLLLRVEWRSPIWYHLRFSAGALYEHYAATEFTDNTFDLGGGELAARLVLARAWLQVSYRADARAYPDPSRNGQVDFEEQLAATSDVRLHATVRLSLGYRFLDVGSNEPTAVLQRHRVDIGVAWAPLTWLSSSVGYALWVQALPNGAPPLSSTMPGGPRQDLAHALTADVRVHVRRWLDLFARYDFIRSTSDQPNGRYQLDEVVAGVAVGWTFAKEQAPPPPPLAPQVHGREVTFHARARPGARVGVVGDWNGWQAQPLASAGGDRYEGAYTLPPGRHAWALSIDGAVVVPPEASGFVDDGFGGKNATVDVP